MNAVESPAPGGSGPGRGGRDGAGEVLAAVRQRTARALRLFMAAAGAPVIAFVFYKAAVERPARPVLVLGLACFVAALALLTMARRRSGPALMGAVMVLLAVIPVSGFLSLGPGFGSSAGVIAVGCLAAIFFGGRAAVAIGIGIAALLAALGVVQDRGDQVGLEGLWSAPAWLYNTAAVATLAWVGITFSAVTAVLRGLTASTEELRQALERERAERDARIASERALAASARLDAIGRLAAGVVHDTRNTLAVLKAGLSELGRRPGSADDREVVADMQHALQSAQETMRQLLSLGAEAPAPAGELEVAERLEGFARAVSRLLPASIAIRIEPRDPGRVRLSAGLLDQALLNLCLNARDAMPGGGGLRLGVAASEDGGRPVLAVEVEDQGKGLHPEIAARLFEPFATSKGDGEGTGLGLSMVKGFAVGAGGRVEVRSEPGRGTCFRIVLPRVEGEPTGAG